MQAANTCNQLIDCPSTKSKHLSSQDIPTYSSHNFHWIIQPSQTQSKVTSVKITLQEFHGIAGI